MPSIPDLTICSVSFHSMSHEFGRLLAMFLIAIVAYLIMDLFTSIHLFDGMDFPIKLISFICFFFAVVPISGINLKRLFNGTFLKFKKG